MFDRDTVQALRNSWVKTLDAFVEEANKTRQCFEGIENASDVTWWREVLLKQRISENQALERYQSARRTLFVLATNGGSQDWTIRRVSRFLDRYVSDAHAALPDALNQ